MSDSAERVPLDYRPRPRREIPAWLSRDKLAELCVGLGWTACGCAALVLGLGWLFYHLEPRGSPWRVFAAVTFAVNSGGLALTLASFALGAWRDGLLRGVAVLALVIAGGAYGGGYALSHAGRAAEAVDVRGGPSFPDDLDGAEVGDVEATPPI